MENPYVSVNFHIDNFDVRIEVRQCDDDHIINIGLLTIFLSLEQLKTLKSQIERVL